MNKTHGLSLLADLFVDAGDTVILHDLFWGNYRLIFEDRMGAHLLTFPLFATAGTLNLEALERLLKELKGEKVIVLLNFPNNPTGYSPSKSEGKQLLELLRRGRNHERDIDDLRVRLELLDGEGG